MNTAIGEEMLADLEEAMRDVVVDPELGINVVDLGLVYGIGVEKGDTGTVALIDMTLTSAARPLTDVIEDQTVTALVGAGLVNEIKINWVWNPPWGRTRSMAEDGRATACPRVHRLGHFWLARADLRDRRQGVLEVVLVTAISPRNGWFTSSSRKITKPTMVAIRPTASACIPAAA